MSKPKLDQTGENEIFLRNPVWFFGFFELYCAMTKRAEVVCHPGGKRHFAQETSKGKYVGRHAKVSRQNADVAAVQDGPSGLCRRFCNGWHGTPTYRQR